MTHRFPIKEIALQAGLSTATIDRALNGRKHVSPQTAAQVARAIAELEGQETQLSARGRRMFFDFVIEAPMRFSREVKQAAEHVAPQMAGANCRLRFVIQEMMSEGEVVGALARVSKRGSQGLCLKARDTPLIRESVNALMRAGIPVVTLVTDIQSSERLAYVGLDNASAGRTAAYLIATAIGEKDGSILTVRSNEDFRGEEQREKAFAQELNRRSPRLKLHELSGGSGVHYETSKLMRQSEDALHNVVGVYSMGGGNRAILAMLADHRLKSAIYIAHDLDRSNRALLAQQSIDYVLHHDLRVEMNNVLLTFLHYHRLVSDPPFKPISDVQVVTPMNIPPVFR